MADHGININNNDKTQMKAGMDQPQAIASQSKNFLNSIDSTDNEFKTINDANSNAPNLFPNIGNNSNNNNIDSSTRPFESMNNNNNNNET